MVTEQPKTLEEALALLKKQQQALATKDHQLKEKDSLIEAKEQELQEADKVHQEDIEKLNKNNVLLESKKRQVTNIQNQLDKKIKKLESNTKKLKEANKKLDKQQNKYNKLKQDYKDLQDKFNALKERMGIYNFNFWKATTEKTKQLSENEPYDMGAGCNESDANQESNNNGKNGSGRKNIHAKYNLPVRVYEDKLTGDDRFCEICKTELKAVRKHVQERLVHVPGYEYIERYIYYSYECPNCSGIEEDGKAITSYEGSMVEQGIATPSLLAHVFVSKYLQHTPFYCQAQVYRWQKVSLCRQNFTKWQLLVYERLKPLEELLFGILKKSKYLMMDETPYKVQRINETERQAELWKNQTDNDLEKADEEDDIEVSMKQCYIWLTLGEYNGHKIIKYNFRWTRCGTFVKEMLEGFEGSVIMADGFSGYDCAVNHWNEEHPEHKIKRAACNTHSRRPWFNSLKVNGSPLAEEIVEIYNEIFKVEETYRAKLNEGKITEEEFLAKRKEESLKLFDKMELKIKNAKLKYKYLQSGSTSKAITYFENHKDELKEYLNYPFLTPSTNEAEQKIRPLTVTRKVSMFFGSGPGADSSCFLASLIEMAKNEDISPEDYLRCLFEQFPKIDPTNKEELEQLLPWNIKITPFEMRGQWEKDEDYEALKKKAK